MKQILFFMAFGALASTAFAQLPSRQVCSQRIAQQLSLVDVAKQRFVVGELTRADVAQAELDLLDTQLGCAEITRDQYCKPENLEKAQTLVDGVKGEISTGQRNVSDLQVVQQRQQTMLEICN